MLKKLFVGLACVSLLGLTACSSNETPQDNIETDLPDFAEVETTASNTFIGEGNISNALITGWTGDVESFIKEKGFEPTNIDPSEIPEGAADFYIGSNEECSIRFIVEYQKATTSNPLFNYVTNNYVNTASNGAFNKLESLKVKTGDRESTGWETIVYQKDANDIVSETDTGSLAEETANSQQMTADIIIWNDTDISSPYVPGDPTPFNQVAKAGVTCLNDDVDYVTSMIEDIKKIDGFGVKVDYYE